MDLSEFNLTPSAKKALKDAEFIAETFGHLKVIDLHLMVSILNFNHNNIDYVFHLMGLLKKELKKVLSMLYLLIKSLEEKRKYMLQK